MLLKCLLATCKECNSAVELKNVPSKRQGFSLKLLLQCCVESCTWSHEFFTSTMFNSSEKDSRGKKPFNINYRSVITFREIGKGHEAMKRFTTIMNMPPPLVWQSYKDII